MIIANLGYKVCSVDNNIIKSLDPITERQVQFIPHQWSKPVDNFGPICIFTEYDNAFNYIERMQTNRVKIFFCEFKKSTEDKVWFSYYKNFYRQYLMQFKNQLAKGTLLADSVRILDSAINPKFLEIGYKVVYYNDQLDTYISSAHDKLQSIEYKINKWTLHKDLAGPLTIFSNLSDAEEYRNSFGINKKNYKIFASLYIPSKRKFTWVAHIHPRTLGKTYLSELYATVFAEKIMLREEIL